MSRVTQIYLFNAGGPLLCAFGYALFLYAPRGRHDWYWVPVLAVLLIGVSRSNPDQISQIMVLTFALLVLDLAAFARFRGAIGTGEHLVILGLALTTLGQGAAWRKEILEPFKPKEAASDVSPPSKPNYVVGHSDPDKRR